eukprot:PhF_6_TR21004/c0_g2_i1/m.30162
MYEPVDNPIREDALGYVKSLLQPLYTQGRLSKAEFVRICKVGVQHVVTTGSRQGLEIILWRELAGSGITKTNTVSAPTILVSPRREFDMPVKQAEILAAQKRRETMHAIHIQSSGAPTPPPAPTPTATSSSQSTSFPKGSEEVLEQILRQLQRPWSPSPTRRSTGGTTSSYGVASSYTSLARVDTDEFLERAEIMGAESLLRCEAMRQYVSERLRSEYLNLVTPLTSAVRQTTSNSAPRGGGGFGGMSSHHRASTPPPTMTSSYNTNNNNNSSSAGISNGTHIVPTNTPKDKLRLLQVQNERITTLFTEMKKKEKELDAKKLRAKEGILGVRSEYPPRTEVIECVRSILQPLHDGKQIPPDTFVNVVKTVSSQFFQTRYKEGDEWRADLKVLVMQALQK